MGYIQRLQKSNFKTKKKNQIKLSSFIKHEPLTLLPVYIMQFFSVSVTMCIKGNIRRNEEVNISTLDDKRAIFYVFCLKCQVHCMIMDFPHFLFQETLRRFIYFCVDWCYFPFIKQQRKAFYCLNILLHNYRLWHILCHFIINTAFKNLKMDKRYFLPFSSFDA